MQKGNYKDLVLNVTFQVKTLAGHCRGNAHHGKTEFSVLGPIQGSGLSGLRTVMTPLQEI